MNNVYLKLTLHLHQSILVSRHERKRYENVSVRHLIS